MSDAVAPIDQLESSIASLGQSIDKANLRLDMTRAALKAVIGNDFAYLSLLATIEAAVEGGMSLSEFAEEIAP